MPAISPDGLARTIALARMADPTTGFNPNYLLAVANYPGLTKTPTPPLVLDFSDTSQNLFLGQISEEQIVSSSTFKLPLVTAYAKAGANTNKEKFVRFAGLVRCYINFYLSDNILKSARAIHDYESWGDAVTGAMVETFNNPNIATQTPWTGPVTYNGDIGWERMPVTDKVNSNWGQKISFLMSFLVTIS